MLPLEGVLRTNERSLSSTLSDPFGLEVHTPPRLVQKSSREQASDLGGRTLPGELKEDVVAVAATVNEIARRSDLLSANWPRDFASPPHAAGRDRCGRVGLAKSTSSRS
jgi:hypothetical protein